MISSPADSTESSLKRVIKSNKKNWSSCVQSIIVCAVGMKMDDRRDRRKIIVSGDCI